MKKMKNHLEMWRKEAGLGERIIEKGGEGRGRRKIRCERMFHKQTKNKKIFLRNSYILKKIQKMKKKGDTYRFFQEVQELERW